MSTDRGRRSRTLPGNPGGGTARSHFAKAMPVRRDPRSAPTAFAITWRRAAARARRPAPIAAALLVALAPGLSCSVPDTRPEAHYASLAAAAADGAVARGWVPETLPPDATDIWEMHDLDTEEVWIRFTGGSGALAELARSCDAVSPLEVAWPRGTRRLSWWPHEMSQAVSRPASPWSFFRCPSPDRYPGQRYTLPTFLAIAGDQPFAWYWRRP